MTASSLLKNISCKVGKINDSTFSVPVEEQKAFLKSLPKPMDDIDRSYLQYKCQMMFNKNFFIMIAETFAAAPLLVYYLLKPSNKIFEETKDSVLFADGKDESIIPVSLKNRMGKYSNISEKKEFLSRLDKIFFFRVAKRYPFSWFFLLKVLLKIRFYSYQIQTNHPRMIVVCNEYSYTSSVLTLYCKENNIKHVNVMHGEKLFYIGDSYFRYDKCYIWDSSYKELFVDLEVPQDQFIIEVPPCLLFPSEGTENNKYIDYTYYLQAESGVFLRKIFDYMKILQEKGYVVAIRPHPRYTNIKEFENISQDRLSQIMIESNQSVSIEQSVKRTKNAISLYSTVLQQAYYNGTQVVIDDLTDRKKYEKLMELKYCMMSKPHKVLSEVIAI